MQKQPARIPVPSYGHDKTKSERLPQEIKKPKSTINNRIALRKHNTLVLAWKDKKVVTMLSTSDTAKIAQVNRKIRSGGEISIDKPDIALNYTKSIGGVDRADHYAMSYSFLRKSLKWWRKLFFWRLEIYCVNSSIIY